MSEISENDFISLVHSRMKAIDDVKLFYLLNRDFKWHKNYSLNAVKCCLALADLGLLISSNIYSSCMGCTIFNSNSILHRIGDRKIITLIRDHRDSRQLFYIFNPRIQELMKE